MRMTRQPGQPTPPSARRTLGTSPFRGIAPPAFAVAATISIAALLTITGCAGNATDTTTIPLLNNHPAPDTTPETDPFSDTNFRRDPIASFREPAYAIEGRPVILFPAPPRDLTAWWLPPVPELRETNSGRPLNARLIWLAALSGNNTARSDGLAWLGTHTIANTTTGAAQWSSFTANDAARLAASDSEADRAKLGDSGLWVVIVEELRAGESITLVQIDSGDEGEASQTLAMRSLAPLPTGATDLTPLHPPDWETLDRPASARLAASLTAAWRDPLQRWRVRLLADRFAGDGSFVTPLAGPADPVVEEIAAQFERLWREALGTLLERDATLAAEVFAELLPIVELVPGVALPVWRADLGVEWALLAALLDDRTPPDRIANFARAIRESRPALIGWIEQDAAWNDDGFDPNRALLRTAELHGRTRRATVEGGSATMPGAELPGLGTASFAIEIAPHLSTSTGTGATRLTLRSGALSQSLPTAPRAAPVLAPGYTINALWRAWTAQGFFTGQPTPAVASRADRFVPATAAILTRDPVERRWVLFIECLRDPAAPGSIHSDELRVWFNTTQPVIVDATGVLQDLPGMGSTIELLAHETLTDRWSATLAFRDSDEESLPWAEPIRFALQRSEQLGTGNTRTSSWPRPKLPSQSPNTPPGTMGLDLSAWDRALEAAESFDVLQRDDQRDRGPVAPSRTEDPLPGPTP